MPAYRSKQNRCVGYLEEEAKVPKTRKPRQPKPVLTEEEKEQAKQEKLARKAALDAKKTWEAALVPWLVNESLRFPIGTLAFYKSDAKSAYSVTEKEILTLPHECIPNSSKAFFSYDAVKDLALRKFQAGVGKPVPQYHILRDADALRLFKKTDDDNRRRRHNFQAQFYGYIDPSMYRRGRY